MVDYNEMCPIYPMPRKAKLIPINIHNLEVSENQRQGTEFDEQNTNIKTWHGCR